MNASRWGLAIVVAGSIGAVACVTAPREGVHPGTAADAVVAGALTADQLGRDGTKTVYGWHVEVVGDRTRYLTCSTAEACSFRAVEVASSSLVATRVVGRTTPIRDDGTRGDETEVVRLTIADDGATSRGGVSSDSRGMVVR